MRPKKRILIVGTVETKVSILKFMLATQGFTVTVAASAAEAVLQVKCQQCDLLLCQWPLPGIEALLDECNSIDPWMRSLVLAPGLERVPDDLNASYVVTCTDYPPSVVLERVKMLTARKRGPRSASGPVKYEAPEPVAAAEPNEPQEAIINGEPIRMPAKSSMGAEMIDPQQRNREQPKAKTKRRPSMRGKAKIERMLELARRVAA